MNRTTVLQEIRKMRFEEIWNERIRMESVITLLEKIVRRGLRVPFRIRPTSKRIFWIRSEVLRPRKKI